MNRTKLEIVNLNNEDLIATSCLSVFGLGEVYEKKAYYSQNNNDLKETLIELPDEVDLPNGFYHFDKNGNIIEVCPVWNGKFESDSNTEEVHAAHHITWIDD